MMKTGPGGNILFICDTCNYRIADHEVEKKPGYHICSVCLNAQHAALNTIEYRRKMYDALSGAVRETGYNCCQISVGNPKGQAHSRSIGLYISACETLRLFAHQHGMGNEAEEFIDKTYDPKKLPENEFVNRW